MKFVLCLLCGVLSGSAARAQFYAPPVDFHDVAQRRFPVEAARVLAWLQKEVPISEVTYRVETDAAGQTIWKIEWRRNAEIARKATVHYAEADLRTGAAWYRSVWAQLTGADWILPPTPADLVTSFWEGAEGAGLARMTGIASGLQQLAAAPQPSAAECARLSGTLVQAALPMLASSATLDGSLLARSAAWLCAAEQKSATPAGAEWATILTLAGRGPDAQKAWAASQAPASPVGRCWDFLVRMPPAREALPTICGPENRLYAAPVFLAYAAADPVYGQHFVPLGPELYRDRIPLLYDYAPGLNGGVLFKTLSEQHPAAGVKAVLENLQELEPWAGDAMTAPKLASEVPDFAKAKRGPFAPPSPELASLIGQGIVDDTGPLVPVAVVTARDLLMFLFEGSGEQFCRMADSLRAHHERAARDCQNNWVKPIAGWHVFESTGEKTRLPSPEMGRYQYLHGRPIALRLVESPPADWPPGPDAYLRRRWLLDNLRGLESLLVHEGRPPLFTESVRRTLREGNQRVAGALLRRDDRVTSGIPGQKKWHFDETIDDLRLRGEILAVTPADASGHLAVLKEKLDRQQEPLAYAREMERFHWQSGLGIMPQTVFHQYVRANALTSARRFYDRWARTMTDPAAFGSMLGEANFALAVLQSDREWARSALADIAPTADRSAELAAALFNDDVVQATLEIEEYKKKPAVEDRVPSYNRLSDWFPLLPALKDAQHPEHEKALTTFPRRGWSLLPQWVLLAKAHLPPEEAIRFIEYGDDEGERDLLVLALRGDARAFAETYDRTEGRSPDIVYGQPALHREGARAILSAWLRNLLLKIPPPKEEPDLMPPNSEPLFPLLQRIAAER